MTGSDRIARTIRPLLCGLAVLGTPTLPVRADPPFGSAEWVRAQEAARGAASATPSAAPSTAPAPLPPAETGVPPPRLGEGMAVQPPPPEEVVASAPAPEGAPTDSTSSRSVNPLSRMALGDLRAFKSRPLFAPSRRPPFTEPILAQAAPPPEPVAVESPAPDLRLVGIVAGVDRAVAILGRSTGEPPVSVRVGDTVETWRVHLIAPDRVVLRQGEREQVYRLFAGASAAIRDSTAPRKPAAALPHLPARSATAEPQ